MTKEFSCQGKHREFLCSSCKVLDSKEKVYRNIIFTAIFSMVFLELESGFLLSNFCKQETIIEISTGEIGGWTGKTQGKKHREFENRI